MSSNRPSIHLLTLALVLALTGFAMAAGKTNPAAATTTSKAAPAVVTGKVVPVPANTVSRKLSPPILPRDTLPQPDPRRVPHTYVSPNSVQPLPWRSNQFYHVNGRRVIYDRSGVRRFNNARSVLIRQRSFRKRR